MFGDIFPMSERLKAHIQWVYGMAQCREFPRQCPHPFLFDTKLSHLAAGSTLPGPQLGRFGAG